MVYRGIAPDYICQLLAKETSGIVQMCNSKGIYLQIENQFVLLCPLEQGVVPIGAAVENYQQLAGFFEQGQNVSVCKGNIRTQRYSFQLLLQPVEQDLRQLIPEKESLEKAVELLRQRPVTTGLAPLIRLPDDNVWCKLARPRVKALLIAIERNETQMIEECVQPLMGLGTGLTPSGDDLLCGLIFGLRHSPWREKEAVRELMDKTLEFAEKNTHPISAAFLKAIAADEPFGKLSDAWADPGEVGSVLMTVGSNSGSEMLLGLILAARLLYSE